MGVWIETRGKDKFRTGASHTLRGCVDWNCFASATTCSCDGHTLRGCVDWNKLDEVTKGLLTKSHPSWVCGLKLLISMFQRKKNVTPFVGVWIETLIGVNLFKIIKSHPSWVCGLKLAVVLAALIKTLSHPSWVCGLKHYDNSERWQRI